MSPMLWSEEKIKKMTIGDFAFLKIALVLLGIIVGSFIPMFVQQYLWVFILVLVAMYLLLLYRIFKKK